MKRLFLLLLPLILAGCVRVQIGRFAPTVTPTPEMLIVRRTDPTREPSPTPVIPEVIYTVTALAIPKKIPTSTPMGFDPVIIGNFRLDFLGYSLLTSITGVDYIELNYRFTNNSSETTSFIASFSTSAFQDGIGLPIYIASNSESITEIRPGTSINVKDAFQIRTGSMVELEFRPFLQVWQDPVTRYVRLPQ